MTDLRLKLAYSLVGITTAAILYFLLSYWGITFEMLPGTPLSTHFSKALPVQFVGQPPAVVGDDAAPVVEVPVNHFSPPSYETSSGNGVPESPASSVQEETILISQKPEELGGRAAWFASRNLPGGGGGGGRGAFSGGGAGGGGSAPTGKPGDETDFFFFPGGDLPDVVATNPIPGSENPGGDIGFPPPLDDGTGNDFPPVGLDDTGKNSFVDVPVQPTNPNSLQNDNTARVPDSTSALGAMAVSMLLLAGLKRSVAV